MANKIMKISYKRIQKQVKVLQLISILQSLIDRMHQQIDIWLKAHITSSNNETLFRQYLSLKRR